MSRTLREVEPKANAAAGTVLSVARTALHVARSEVQIDGRVRSTERNGMAGRAGSKVSGRGRGNSGSKREEMDVRRHVPLGRGGNRMIVVEETGITDPSHNSVGLSVSFGIICGDCPVKRGRDSARPSKDGPSKIFRLSS